MGIIGVFFVEEVGDKLQGLNLIKEKILLGYSKKSFEGELRPSFRMIFFQVFNKVDYKIYAKGTNRKKQQ